MTPTSNISLLKSENERLAELVEQYDCEKRAAKAAAEEAERRYAAIVQNVAQGIYQSTYEGRLLSASVSMAKLLGYDSPEELILTMRDLRRQFYLQPESRDTLMSLLERNSVVRNFECEVFKKDGTPIWISINAHVVRNHSGQVILYEGTIDDVTARKQAEERLLQLNETLRKKMDELERSNSELEQFAYAASHDLQEPLRMVSSYVNLLARKLSPSLDAETEEFVRYAVEGARRMKSLIDDLLAYSTVGRTASPPQLVDCNRLVGELAQVFALRVQETGAELRFSQLPVLWGNASELAVLFQNLLANALKFHAPGNQPLISIRASMGRTEWLFSVSDNGIGFDLEYADRIFRIFQRLHGKEAYSGTGIGLAICKKIVERHGGRIWAQSAPGAGATFFFTLPLKTPTNT